MLGASSLKKKKKRTGGRLGVLREQRSTPSIRPTLHAQEAQGRKCRRQGGCGIAYTSFYYSEIRYVAVLR